MRHWHAVSPTRWLVRRLPAWVRAAPIEVMVAVFGIPSGLAAMLGPASSRALAELLPWWAGKLWAVCLVAGCIAWLAGLSSVREVDGRLTVGRLPIMLLGLRLLSMAAAVYGTAIIVISGREGLLAAWPLLVLALGTAVRCADLSNRARP